MQEVEEDRCQRGVGGRQVEGVKDEDERIRWEARRCHFGNGEREKTGGTETQRKDAPPSFKKHKESFFCES